MTRYYPGEGAWPGIGIMLGRKGHFFGAECPNNGPIFTVECPSLGLVLEKCPSSGLIFEILLVLFHKNHIYPNLWLSN